MMKQLTYYIFYGAVYLLSLLPMWVHYRLSDLMFVIIYHIARYRKKVVEKNLRNAFPEKSWLERKRIERKFYRFFCDYMVENVKLLTMKKENVMRRMVFEGMDDMARSFETHDFVFIYLGHYCNWEYVASLQWWSPPGVKCAQLYSALESEAFDRLFLTIRGRYGGDNINKKDSLRAIMRYRQSGQKAIIGFISDQGPKWQNIHRWMNFLNQDTPVFTGTERIAKKVNAAIYYADMSHPRRGYYRCHMRRMTDNVADYKENELTIDYMRLLEQSIREVPQFWLWTHNRWKRQRTDEEREQNIQEVHHEANH